MPMNLGLQHHNVAKQLGVEKDLIDVQELDSTLTYRENLEQMRERREMGIDLTERERREREMDRKIAESNTSQPRAKEPEIVESAEEGGLESIPQVEYREYEQPPVPKQVSRKEALEQKREEWELTKKEEALSDEQFAHKIQHSPPIKYGGALLGRVGGIAATVGKAGVSALKGTTEFAGGYMMAKAQHPKAQNVRYGRGAIAYGPRTARAQRMPLQSSNPLLQGQGSTLLYRQAPEGGGLLNRPSPPSRLFQLLSAPSRGLSGAGASSSIINQKPGLSRLGRLVRGLK